MDTGEIEAEMAGGFDGRSFKPSFKAFYPGVDPEALGTVNQLINDYGIILVPLFGENGSTTYMQIGQEDLWAVISAGKSNDRISK